MYGVLVCATTLRLKTLCMESVCVCWRTYLVADGGGGGGGGDSRKQPRTPPPFTAGLEREVEGRKVMCIVKNHTHTHTHTHTPLRLVGLWCMGDELASCARLPARQLHRWW